MKTINFSSADPNMKMKKASGFVSDIRSEGTWTVPRFEKLSHRERLDLFASSEWLNAVIIRIVNDCAKVKPRVRLKEYDKKPTKEQERQIKEIRDFLDEPNPNKESFRDIRTKYIQDLLVHGRGALEKVNKRFGGIKELYSLTVNGLKIRQDNSGNLRKKKTYKLSSKNQIGKSAKDKYYDIDECIFTVLRPLTDSSYGISPVDVVCSAVAAEILRNEYNNNFFVNGGEASGVLSVEGMSKIEFKRFKEYWKNSFKGAKNAHRLAVVNTPISYARMSITNRDMEFTEFGKEIRNKIMAVFQMQPFIMGIIDNTTGKLNSGEQVQAYKDGALFPILEKEAHVYTKEIIQDGFGYKDLEITFSHVDQKDEKTQAEIDTINLDNMTTTVNEVRSRRGRSSVKWGDTPISSKPGGAQVDPNTGKLIPPSAQGQNNAQNPPKEPKQPNPNNNTQNASKEPKKRLYNAKNLVYTYINSVRNGDFKMYEHIKSVDPEEIEDYEKVNLLIDGVERIVYSSKDLKDFHSKLKGITELVEKVF